ncbi:MAG TPA: APC family permease [Candidatus Baltobacteraceae bacterium]|nr:APC family permease [Candidatus Baltobacteraceae bacterium]
MSGLQSISSKVATAVGLGAIIGAGIFVLSGTAIALAGTYAILAFILVGIVALMVAFQLGELGSLMPHVKGGAYSYAYKAFGSELGFITGILLYFSFATAISVIALGFGSYLASLLGMSTAEFAIPFAIALILVLAVVNILGIRKAAKADFGLVLIKIAILAIFIIFSFMIATRAGFNLSHFTSGLSGKGLGGMFAASVVILFAYSGFQAISTFTGRVIGGGTRAAKAIVYSVIISMVLYVLVAISLILLVPASSYTISANPLSFALQSVNAPSWLFLLVNIGALIATTSATLAMMLSASRMLHQISSDHLLPKILRSFNRSRDVAVNCVILSAVIGIIMLFAGNLFIIAAISNFGLLFSYLIVSFCIVHFRRNKAKAEFRSPFYPYLPAVSVVALFALMIGMPREALLFGVMLILALIIMYYFLREYESKKIVRIKLFK